MEFGWFEAIRIRRGDYILSPFPTYIRTLKLGSASRETIDGAPNAKLRKQVEEFLDSVSDVDDGVIRFWKSVTDCRFP